MAGIWQRQLGCHCAQHLLLRWREMKIHLRMPFDFTVAIAMRKSVRMSSFAFQLVAVLLLNVAHCMAWQSEKSHVGCQAAWRQRHRSLMSICRTTGITDTTFRLLASCSGWSGGHNCVVNPGKSEANLSSRQSENTR